MRAATVVSFFVEGNERSIHVVCSPKENYLAIITAYIPSVDEWEPDLRTRRSK